jgi:outer membrane protein assembly factor BamD (BamD/ComL family)
MQNAGKFLIGLAALVLGLFVLGWIVWTTVRKAEDSGRVLFKWIVTAVVFVALIGLALSLFHGGIEGAYIVPPIAAVFGVFMGIMWAPHLGAMIAKPLTSFYDGGSQEVEERPFYAIARAKQKRGNYPQAVAEIRKQLHRFPEDYEGWMLLAEIYANDLKDKNAAIECVEEILRHENHNAKNVAFALNRAADWHLSVSSDREAARECLQQIIARFPGSELAHSAEQRIAHLTTDRMLAEQKERPRLVLTHHDEYIGLRGEVADPRPAAEDPATAAGRLVGRLTEFPQDVEAREELAKIYASHYQRMDLASDQVEQLVASPGVGPKEVTRWLNMLADFHVRVDQDKLAAEGALRRVVQLYPKSAVAAQAEQRIAYLETEMLKNKKSQALKLGSYENNMGLNRASD